MQTSEIIITVNPMLQYMSLNGLVNVGERSLGYLCQLWTGLIGLRNIYMNPNKSHVLYVFVLGKVILECYAKRKLTSKKFET